MPELKNPRHEAFVAEYVKDGNGTRAYKAVYGDVKGAKQSARNLLELASVQERLIEVRTELAVAHGLSQDQIGRCPSGQGPASKNIGLCEREEGPTG